MSEESSQPRRSLDKIVVDPEIQQRAIHIDDAVVSDYAERIQAGDDFPPVVVFQGDDGKLILADGFHRYHAFEKAGKKQVPVDIREGDRRDAILYAIGSNQHHGLQRTRDDKRKSVMTLLADKEWCKWGDRKIARLYSVSPTTVGAIRKELEQQPVQSEPLKDEAESICPVGQIADVPIIEDVEPGTVKFSGEDKTTKASKPVVIDSDEPKTTRTFERGGKQHTMNTAGISKAATPRRKPTEWMSRVKSSCVEVRKRIESHSIFSRDAYEIGTRYASILTDVLPIMREKERNAVLADLNKVFAQSKAEAPESDHSEATADAYRAASGK